MKLKICPKCKSENIQIAPMRWKGDLRWKCLDCNFESEIFPEKEQ